MNQAESLRGVILGENDALIRGIVRSIFVKAQHPIFPAVDGEEAVQLAHQFQASLVILDIGMPRKNGLVACSEIRRLPGYQDVPIVMLTGYVDARIREAARLLGASGFIAKPFRPDQLLAKLSAFLAPPPHGRPRTEMLDKGHQVVQIWRDMERSS